MPDETTAVAESSPAPVAETSIEIPRSGTPEYTEWRVKGTIPEKTKPAVEDPAPSDTVKEPTADSGESPAPKQQEHTDKGNGKNAESRIKQLIAERDRWKSEAEAAKAPKPAEEPKPVQAQPQTYQEWRKNFKAAKWVEQYSKDNPDAVYEDVTAAMADYLGDVRDQFRSHEQQQKAFQSEVEAKINGAKSRYENFDEISRPFVKSFVDDQAIPMAVKIMVSESEVWPDLVFTIASDPQESARFSNLAKTNPGQALRYIAKVENLIQEELGKGSTKVARDGNGQFVKSTPDPAPVKRGPESAPEPPLEIGNRGAGPMDDSARALSAIERGDPRAFKAWKDAEDAKELRRRKGM